MDMESRSIEHLAKGLIAAYDRGERCPPETEAVLREALPPDPACPPACPTRNGKRVQRTSTIGIRVVQPSNTASR